MIKRFTTAVLVTLTLALISCGENPQQVEVPSFEGYTWTYKLGSHVNYFQYFYNFDAEKKELSITVKNKHEDAAEPVTEDDMAKLYSYTIDESNNILALTLKKLPVPESLEAYATAFENAAEDMAISEIYTGKWVLGDKDSYVKFREQQEKSILKYYGYYESEHFDQEALDKQLADIKSTAESLFTTARRYYSYYFDSEGKLKLSDYFAGDLNKVEEYEFTYVHDGWLHNEYDICKEKDIWYLSLKYDYFDPIKLDLTYKDSSSREADSDGLVAYEFVVNLKDNVLTGKEIYDEDDVEVDVKATVVSNVDGQSVTITFEEPAAIKGKTVEMPLWGFIMTLTKVE